MKKSLVSLLSACVAVVASASQPQFASIPRDNADDLLLIPLADNAIRVKIGHYLPSELEELIYSGQPQVDFLVSYTDSTAVVTLPQMSATYNYATDALTFSNAQGQIVLQEVPGGRSIAPSDAPLQAAAVAQRFASPADEHLYGTGQFQDGYVDIRGLSRRLTQVNTQIALPMVLSNKGYALLWNNYGLTDFNPATSSLALVRSDSEGEAVTVDATSTHGNTRETRHINAFEGVIDIADGGDYSILLDVGQTMARKHKVNIDGCTIVDVNNVWLPPTTSFITHLTPGKHSVVVEGEKNDSPTLYMRKVINETEFASPVADALDYTVFVGTPGEAIAAFRQTSGSVPMLPQWAMGYIHCRERYDNQAELLDNAHEFRARQIPIDCIVQDWQWWGKNGWNAMAFDLDKYPDPAAMVADLHDNDMRLMISVWAKVDVNSQLGKQMQELGYYIPGTDWVDFFNPDAADFYWANQSNRLLKPYGIDSWWQDATEPENDDLHNRMVGDSTIHGDIYRNVFPLMVNRRVHAGLKHDDPQRRAMILTRSAFPGIQRYGIATWSGDVGNDWATLRRQLAGGLGQMAAGLPWWTFDAGGFFRPADQHSNTDYQECMLRWVQLGAFLPLMRTHGYMSQTEPWRYGHETEASFVKAINLRYSLLPYIYSIASQVSRSGSTLMRPLVMDFPSDHEALAQRYQFMFGPSILVAPVLEPKVDSWQVYLPQGSDWVDYWTGETHAGGQTVTVPVDIDKIPLMVRAGSIVPHAYGKQFAADCPDAPLHIYVYPGADGSFTLYEDSGDGYGYENGEFSEIDFSWSEADQKLSISERRGSFPGMKPSRQFIIHLPGQSPTTLTYTGTKTIRTE